ncbi:MAG TPA: YkgJ family cysteine cluster protein [Methanolinea sp.]|nr:YkgJ family cysteine cluster protein [Methanolinea sp.]
MPPFTRVQGRTVYDGFPPYREGTMEQVCRQCGRCCERWGWGQPGTVTDLVPWVRAGREDILRHVSVRLSGGRWVSGDSLREGDLSSVVAVRYWQDTGGRPLRYCPFLGRRDDGLAYCAIHAVRPAVCREYAPWNCADGDYLQVKCPACRDRVP